MFDREVLLRPDEPFALPMYGGPAYRPSEAVVRGFCTNIEQIIQNMGLSFPEQLPIQIALATPIDDFTDTYIDLSYLPHNYPQEKIIIGSRIAFHSPVLQDINEIYLSVLGSPWGSGNYQGKNDNYPIPYWPTDPYLQYVQGVITELSKGGLLLQRSPIELLEPSD